MNEIKFTLSASSSSSQNYSLEDEPGVEIPTETPDYIKKITSKRKLNALISLQFWANSRLRTGNIDENNVEMLEDFTQCFFSPFPKFQLRLLSGMIWEKFLELVGLVKSWPQLARKTICQ